MSFFGKFYFASNQSLSGPEKDGVDEFLGMRAPRGRRMPSLPPTDVYESDNGYVVLVELAGVCREDVRVQLSGAVLTIRGIRREACPHCKKAYLQMELHYGEFARQISLPGPVDPQNAEARLEDGILQVFLPHGKKRGGAAPNAILHIEWTVESDNE